MEIQKNTKIRIKQLRSPEVNSLEQKLDHMSASQRNSLISITNKFKNLFSEPDERLTYTTRVIGEIRTNTDTPVYTKSYPYPSSLRDEIESQVSKLLQDGIIRPSRSPYNSPVWVVPKKCDSEGNKQFRMVIDYRKLNTVTIADRYPIPDINEVLAQFGRSKFFTVLDLKSGFHQIPLKKSDIEKTAFSINSGKFEFTRLPFGLKNAPSIFQRALDDILRLHIGKSCYVYIDDIIIFSEHEEQHLNHILEIFQTLNDANMKVQLDKCSFFKRQVEFLGFIVSSEGIRTNPQKVEAILNFPTPQTLKQLRSFLGLSGYYRRFIANYAKIAKPLTSYLRGEEGRISKTESNKKIIVLNTEALEAFKTLKNTLVSQDLILCYPNFKKPFELTTDASNVALGAVLSQDSRPITFISRTLTKSEENYAANERELLAIIWALNALRIYLYGTAKVKIYTDHQPLTYALSSKNHNAKMKRWKAILEEYDYELHYMPGRSNVVADALSRISQVNSMTPTEHSDESSSHELVPTVECPINVFKNQLMLSIGNEDRYTFEIPFPTYHRHIIIKREFTATNLTELLKKYLNPSVINGLFTSESIMAQIQNIYPHHFRCYKSRFTQTQVKDITNKTEQEEQIINEHKRAHRNSLENKNQLIQRIYFPKMKSEIDKIVKQCLICKQHKYDRHPNKTELQQTPIPQYPGHILHIDIYSTEKNLVLTAIDKFSKYAQVRILKSKSIEDIREPLRQILFAFGVPKLIVFDNEKSFNSASICFLLQDQLGIEIYKTPPYSSSVNGQVERFHSTLSEIMRCLKTDQTHRTFEELLDRSVYEYNFSIHSTTKKRPIEVFFGRTVSTDPEAYEKSKQSNIERLKEKQAQDLKYHNKNRDRIKTYNPGDIIYVKINKRLGSKLSPRFKKEVVKENKTSTVITESGKIIHKDNIKS